MRISDWSSDVCSSDLFVDDLYRGLSGLRAPAGARMALPRSERLRPSLSYQFDSAESTRVSMMRRRTADWSAERRCRAPPPSTESASNNSRWRASPSTVTSQDPFTGTNTSVKFVGRSEEHTSELQSLMRNSYAVFCLKKQKE